MGTKQDIRIGLDEKSILHIPGRMVFRKVQGREVVPVIFNFWTFRNIESNIGKNLYDFVLDYGYRMTASNFQRLSWSGKISIYALLFLMVLQLVLKILNLLLGGRFQLIHYLSKFLFLLVRNFFKGRKEFI